MQSRHTFDSLIRHLTRQLEEERDPAEARSLARLVTGAVSGRSNTQLLRDGNLPFPQELLPKVNNILRQLKDHMPLQYILGETVFYGCRLRVSPHVLIPRPETEELVERVVRTLQKEKEPFTVLDIGTGSGCIAVALARHLPRATLLATDISPGALETARENARLNGVQVRFFREDILHPATAPAEKLRCIVSNPPYIPASEKDGMQPEVRDHEPLEALFVPDNDPLLFYRAIAGYAREHLAEDGLLLVECHEKYAREVKTLFEQKGLQEVKVIRDINGKERFVEARKER